MGISVNELKNDLRKEQIMYEEYMELLKSGELDKLELKFQKELDRIKASLQD